MADNTVYLIVSISAQIKMGRPSCGFMGSKPPGCNSGVFFRDPGYSWPEHGSRKDPCETLEHIMQDAGDERRN